DELRDRAAHAHVEQSEVADQRADQDPGAVDVVAQRAHDVGREQERDDRVDRKRAPVAEHVAERARAFVGRLGNRVQVITGRVHLAQSRDSGDSPRGEARNPVRLVLALTSATPCSENERCAGVRGTATMKFEPAPIAGAFVIELEPHQDARGLFARPYCAEAFRSHGLPTSWPQSNTSFSPRRHTLRGIHYAAPPEQEAKLVRCTRGGIYDLILDLRAGSPTCFRWFAVDLDQENRRSLYIPAGVAHGFLTLQADSEGLYQMGAP